MDADAAKFLRDACVELYTTFADAVWIDLVKLQNAPSFTSLWRTRDPLARERLGTMLFAFLKQVGVASVGYSTGKTGMEKLFLRDYSSSRRGSFMDPYPLRDEKLFLGDHNPLSLRSPACSSTLTA